MRFRESATITNTTLIHIGYHKTGTTWLQRVVFREAAIGLREGLSKGEVDRLLVKPRALDFDVAASRIDIQRRLADRKEEGLIAVVSSEELCANPHGGSHLEKEYADRLAGTLPDARVLIVVREQRAMLASAYKQYIRAGAAYSLHTFLNPPSLGDPLQGLPDWRHFRYHTLIQYYRELYGEDRVLVLPYELLQHQPRDFVRRVTEFCGIEADTQSIDALPYKREVHASLTALGTSLKRKLNRYAADVRRQNPEPWFPLTREQHGRVVGLIQGIENRLPAPLVQRFEDRMHARIEEWAGDRFSSSNAVTTQWMKDDLEAFGYQL